MVKFKKKKEHKKDLIMTIITALFFVIGTVCLIVGYYEDIVSWLVKCGIAFLIIGAIMFLNILRILISQRIKEM